MRLFIHYCFAFLAFGFIGETFAHESSCSNNPETFIYIDVPMLLDAKIFSDIKNSTDYTVDLNEGYRDHLEDTYEASVNQLDPAAFHGAIVLTGDLLHGESPVLPKYFWHITKA